jgi:nucleotide-binding STING sensor domain-containing protein
MSSLAFKWLAPASLKRNFDVQEIVAFILPTTYAYYDGLPKLVDFPKNMIIFTTVLVFLLLFLFKVYKKFNENERAISEVLETGYFNNFFYPFATVITDKLRSGQKIALDFKNKNQAPIQTDNIEVKIILPQSKEQMADAIKAINKLAQDATVDNGPWVKAQLADNGKVIIYECPRTMATIEKHLMNGESEYTNEESFKFHRYFIDKFMKDYKAASFDFEISAMV